MSRLTASLLVAVAALLAGGTAALAHWSAPGSGTGASRTATLRPAVVRAEASERTVRLTWVSEAEIEGDPGAAIAYQVLRRGPGDDAFAPVAHGGCAAPLARPATSCEDAVPAGGGYAYRVVAAHRSWTAVSDADQVVVVSTAEPQAPDPGTGAEPDEPAAAPSDPGLADRGAVSVRLADEDGWIDAATVADVAVEVELGAPAGQGDRVVVELRDGAGAIAEGSASVPENATTVVVGGIDARPLAETSSSVADPAAARAIRLTARVAGDAGPAVASATAGKDVTPPPLDGADGLAVRLEPAGEAARLTGTGEPFDAISVVPPTGDAAAATGTVSAEGVLAPVLLPWAAAAGARVTATDPAGNTLTVDVPPAVEPPATPAG